LHCVVTADLPVNATEDLYVLSFYKVRSQETAVQHTCVAAAVSSWPADQFSWLLQSVSMRTLDGPLEGLPPRSWAVCCQRIL
jgi:hypothetical protein